MSFGKFPMEMNFGNLWSVSAENDFWKLLGRFR
jgi:hypothetical protein